MQKFTLLKFHYLHKPWIVFLHQKKCRHQILIPPQNNNFYVITQSNFICCSCCSCTIFILILVGKSKLSPRSGSSLEAVEPHPLKRGHKGFNFIQFTLTLVLLVFNIYRMAEWCFYLWKKFKWSKSLLDRFSKPDEKVPPITKIFHSPAGREMSPSTPQMLFEKLWHVSPLNHEM